MKFSNEAPRSNLRGILAKANKNYRAALLCVLLLAWVVSVPSGFGASYNFDDFKGRLGRRDAALVADPSGHILFSHNSEKALVPASTLKLLTALTAFHYLGKDHRFLTEFYVDAAGDLKIKGYGDPLLISEVIADISEILARQLGSRFETLQDIIVDHTFFKHPIIIPGVTDSSEPYDAPNGALCVNFNTVNFEKAGGNFVSAEPQTPLLPMALQRIQASKLSRGRIRLSLEDQEIFYYAGQLFKFFLASKGMQASGRVRMGRVDPSDELILSYTSPFTLEQTVEKMMTYSNNYIANQILLYTGARIFSPPATLAKAVEAAHKYLLGRFRNTRIQLSEGSGISRQNLISASTMLGLLQEFRPYHHLLTTEGIDFFKTGTLKDVSTRAGYIQAKEGFFFPYVILLNTPGRSAHILSKELQRILLMPE